ncbi:cardiolipin synthase [Chromohalobacter israelensis]|uniref:cardiolipin synthase n=1 Tax=Chromohalobacter israelensis TaxID=141390 RepID=UPI000FFECAFF|nr:cardiolipin synthase [Chromohalobacter salexigens]RXE48285.1 cardiolipin synthase [Chromohalobacter salexigens]
MTSGIIGILIVVIHVLGVLSALMALMSSRTSQGAVAWIVTLLTFPYLAVPIYWIFGRPRFYGYTSARSERDSVLRQVLLRFRPRLEPYFSRPSHDVARIQAVERLAMMPMSTGNRAELLIDGEATFKSLLAGIDSAREYILVQFFIFRADEIGTLFKQHLIQQAERGVRVCLLYDEIGSRSLSGDYLRELSEAGVEVTAFNSSRGWRHRFQINFRNHRKILVVDGREGWTGGFNVADEYLGRVPRYGPWRDTHLKLTGPSVMGLQEAFWEDWYWATGNILSLEWEPSVTCNECQHVVIVPSGPADRCETASLLIQHVIHGAHERLWVTSPYFVPDQGVQDALKLAALRGVDVRVMIPERPDHLLVFLSAFSFLPEMIRHGVRIFRYQPGFLHQKAVLVDDHTALLGSVNLDNRSFRLNFEITAYIPDAAFAHDVETMLLHDFESCREVTLQELDDRPAWRKLVSRAAYLLAPIQ